MENVKGYIGKHFFGLKGSHDKKSQSPINWTTIIMMMLLPLLNIKKQDPITGWSDSVSQVSFLSLNIPAFK